MHQKIYFAGSIRGGRADAGLYARLIAHINETDTVLTEHVGDLSRSVLEQGRARDNAIWLQDTAWLRECDLLLAECTCPSLGVGYELCYAEALGKPCHLFYDAGRCQLSAMLTGDPYFHIHPYRSEADLLAAIDAVLGRL